MPTSFHPHTLQDARSRLMAMYRQVRVLDAEEGGGLTAVADLLLLYASTLHWLACGAPAACHRAAAACRNAWVPLPPDGPLCCCGCLKRSLLLLLPRRCCRWVATALAQSPATPPAERHYRGITSPPVPLNLEDLTLDRAGDGGGGAQGAAAATEPQAANDAGEQQGGAAGSRPASRPSSMLDLTASAAAGGGSESEGAALSSKCCWGSALLCQGCVSGGDAC